MPTKIEKITMKERQSASYYKMEIVDDSESSYKSHRPKEQIQSKVSTKFLLII